MSFSFGRNWLKYSKLLDEERVQEAVRGLRRLLNRETLDGLAFLDIGSGSGLFSIAAIKLGAKRVVAIDIDDDCLSAARRNAEKFLGSEFPGSIEIRYGDLLRSERLWWGQFDVVYAWGSLHHTGDLWLAMENAGECCAPGGCLVVAIYNQTWLSPLWFRIKRLYHRVPAWAQFLMVSTLWASRVAVRLIQGKSPFLAERAMSVWYDAIDWLGGLPYEYAPAHRVINVLNGLGFCLVSSRTTRRSGCNEFVFRRCS